MGVLLHRIGVLESAAVKAAHEVLKDLATTAGADFLYDPDNPDTWTLRDDGSDLFYSDVTDGMGNRASVAQATAANQPDQITLSTGRRVLARSAGDGRMIESGSYAASISQPYTLVIAHRFGDLTAGQKIMDNDSFASARALVGFGYEIFAGSVLSSGSTMDTEWHIVQALFDGASSKIWLDEVEIASGDAGTNALEGISLMARFIGNGEMTDGGRVGFTMGFASSKTPTDLSDIYNHANSTYPIGVSE